MCGRRGGHHWGVVLQTATAEELDVPDEWEGPKSDQTGPTDGNAAKSVKVIGERGQRHLGGTGRFR